jgi:uncharacterized protein YndB with AHSA1/START domain
LDEERERTGTMSIKGAEGMDINDAEGMDVNDAEATNVNAAVGTNRTMGTNRDGAEGTAGNIVIEQDIPASAERVWELWTTPEGIGRWWAPDGFRTDVERLELVPGGELRYAMTAVDEAQVEFMQQHSMPLTTRSRKTFTEVQPHSRLAYSSLIDFVPDHEPYEQLTRIDLTPSSEIPGGTHVTMHMEPLHDQEWTDRLVAGRKNELENLARLAEAEG